MPLISRKVTDKVKAYEHTLRLYICTASYHEEQIRHFLVKFAFIQYYGAISKFALLKNATIFGHIELIQEKSSVKNFV